MVLSRSTEPVAGRSGRLFGSCVLAFVAVFVLFFVALVIADITAINLEAVAEVLRSPQIRAATWLSIWTSVVSVILVLIFAIPMGYALSRYRFPGHVLVDSIVDLPIIFPPLIVGLSLLVFFQTPPGRWIEELGLEFVYQKKGIILCQFLVSASFGIRAAKSTFDDIDPRLEHVALTLGCSRAEAFLRVALPMAKNGIIAGAILAWARAFGIFGPLMVFVGAVRMRTEVLPTTIYLEQSIGRIEVAIAVALLMLTLAIIALVSLRMVIGGKRLW